MVDTDRLIDTERASLLLPVCLTRSTTEHRTFNYLYVLSYGLASQRYPLLTSPSSSSSSSLPSYRPSSHPPQNQPEDCQTQPPGSPSSRLSRPSRLLPSPAPGPLRAQPALCARSSHVEKAATDSVRSPGCLFEEAPAGAKFAREVKVLMSVRVLK